MTDAQGFASVDADQLQQCGKCGGFEHEAAAVLQHIRNFVEGLHQPQFHGGVLLGLAQSAAIVGAVFLKGARREKDADRKNRFAVGADVEDELGGGDVRRTVMAAIVLRASEQVCDKNAGPSAALRAVGNDASRLPLVARADALRRTRG